MTQYIPLSGREQGVLELLLQGKSNKQIALALGISVRTVEFHLKNIYAKFDVRSRIELILRLGNTTGNTIHEELVDSTVDRLGEKAENKGRFNWIITSNPITSTTFKELNMQTLSSIRNILIGGVTAVFTGFSWIALFIYYGNLTVNGTKQWAIPLIIILTVIGGAVGLIGRLNNSSLKKIFFSTLLGTSLGFFSIIPVLLLLVLPLEKLIVQAGLPDPLASTKMASDVSNLFGTILIITIWLVTGVAIGILLLFVSIRKSERTNNQALRSA